MLFDLLDDIGLLGFLDEKESEALHVGFLEYCKIIALTVIFFFVLIYCANSIRHCFCPFKLFLDIFGCLTLCKNLTYAVIFHQKGGSRTTSLILFLRWRLLWLGLGLRCSLIRLLFSFKWIFRSFFLCCFLLNVRFTLSFSSITDKEKKVNMAEM